MTDSSDMLDVFGPDGILAHRLTGYEFRPGQAKMAAAVATTLRPHDFDFQGTNLLAVEAGTGIGKTLAYLVPAALCGQRVVVSTGTLNLQDQILHKEIPFIQEHVAPDLTAICVKGRQNYLCIYRWQQFMADPQLSLLAESEEVARLREWAAETETGDRAELAWLGDNSPLWQHVSATNTQCLGMQCPDSAACFVNRLRVRAGKARILIVNHHLFFSDLALRSTGHAEVLPRYGAVVFDEAHHLENVATQYFGFSFSLYQILDMVSDLEKNARNELNKKDCLPLVQLSRALASEADRFVSLFPKEKGRFPLFDMLEKIPDWPAAVAALKERLIGLYNHLEKLAFNAELWGMMQRRCSELLDNLHAITEEMSSSYVYWVERREKTVVLSASPIEVAPDLRKKLYDQVRSVIFASATLSTGGDFTYFLDRLGLPADTEAEVIPTPFDFAHRSLLYVPDATFHAPDQPAYSAELQETVRRLLLASNGRALVLCTSLKSMHSLHQNLRDILPFPLLVQGSAPRSALLDLFRRQTNSVLFAVASFWEGVDVPGEALSCVIIDKLPFEVPNDPVMMARINKIREEGGNPFIDFQVPRAILTLRQGVGRLMRTSNDRGIMAIMDTRLFTKKYGKIFLRSLPPSPVTRNLADVAAFYQEDGNIEQ